MSMTARGFATQHTMDFLRGVLPQPPCSIVEVGCGDGALAAELVRAGYGVIGLDPSAPAIDAAKQRGVDAMLGTWPNDWPAHKYKDVVLFTRSLHHIGPLAAALDHAAAVLPPTGLLILEEFAVEQIEARQAEWFASQMAHLNSSGVHPPHCEGQGTESDALAAWHREHDHDLHAWTAIEQAVRDRFTDVRVTLTPFLFRYFTDLLPQDALGADRVADLLKQEVNMVQSSGGTLIGRRLVARKRP